nr:PREDICTED: protein NRT1/ PTR FAMILY 1.2-like isoform X3 [Daucus carota subsp. sativus]
MRRSDEMLKQEEPLLLTPSPNPKGGFKTIPFILGYLFGAATDLFERLASSGLSPNMIRYLMEEYHMDVTTGNNIILFWSAATNFLPVLGAFIADSFLGRYRMIGVGTIFSLLGMAILWLTTFITQARPPPCTGSVETTCIPSNFQSYFNWYIATSSVAVLLASTVVVYIQDKMGWEVGYGIPVVLVFLSVLSFFVASPLYVKPKSKSSLITGFFRVIAAAYNNRHVDLPTDTTSVLFHCKEDSRRIVPSEKLRFLNKACLIKNGREQERPADGERLSSNICTVDQVEEFKALLKVIPLWSTGMIMSINMNQPSFPLLQATSMDRHITSNFEIPAGSFGTIGIIALTLWVVLYNQVILRLGSKIMGRTISFTIKQRMGTGIFVSFLAMVVSAVVEGIRRDRAVTVKNLNVAVTTVQMSAMWLVPQNCLSGIAEALNAVALIEFFYREFPSSMSSIASTMYGVGMSAGNLLASFLLSTIDDVTGREGKISWISSNIDEGHYDYYYWFLAGLSLINLMYFFLCSWAYGPCEGECIGSGTSSTD